MSERERRAEEGQRCHLEKQGQGSDEELEIQGQGSDEELEKREQDSEEELRSRVEEEQQEMRDLSHRWEENCSVNKPEEEHSCLTEEVGDGMNKNSVLASTMTAIKQNI